MSVINVDSETVVRSPFAVGHRRQRIRHWAAKPSVVVLVLITAIALAAPLLAPHGALTPVGAPFSSPGTGGALLGTDQVGRDILSRILFGLASSWFASIAIVLA